MFLDAKPAENLEPSDKNTLCFAAIMVNSMQEGVPGLKPYKKTRKERKKAAAEKIIEALTNDISVEAIGIAGKSNGAFIHIACDIINRSREMLGAHWETRDGVPTHLIWNENSLNRSRVLGLSIYAGILPIIGLRAAMMTAGLPPRKFYLLLDNLPIDSQIGMDLIDAMFKESDIAQMLEENRRYGAEYEIGVFGRWKDENGLWHKGKCHPNAILVDWFSVSCMAKVNPEQVQKEAGHSYEYIDLIASIWDYSFEPKKWSIINLDDPDYIANDLRPFSPSFISRV